MLHWLHSCVFLWLLSVVFFLSPCVSSSLYFVCSILVSVRLLDCFVSLFPFLRIFWQFLLLCLVRLEVVLLLVISLFVVAQCIFKVALCSFLVMICLIVVFLHLFVVSRLCCLPCVSSLQFYLVCTLCLSVQYKLR